VWDPVSETRGLLRVDGFVARTSAAPVTTLTPGQSATVMSSQQCDTITLFSTRNYLPIGQSWLVAVNKPPVREIQRSHSPPPYLLFCSLGASASSFARSFRSRAASSFFDRRELSV
jgi:hypothetical protein